MIKIVGCALIKNKEGKYLLERENKEVEGGVIIPPGGKLEDNETVAECVVREVKEELNIDIKVTKLEAVMEKTYEDGIWIILYYGAEIINGSPKIMEEGKITEIKWIDKEELANFNLIKWLN